MADDDGCCIKRTNIDFGGLCDTLGLRESLAQGGAHLLMETISKSIDAPTKRLKSASTTHLKTGSTTRPDSVSAISVKRDMCAKVIDVR